MRRWGLSFAWLCLMVDAAAAQAQQHPRLVSVIGPVVPSQRHVDLHALPRSVDWHTGLQPFDAEPEQEDDHLQLANRP